MDATIQSGVAQGVTTERLEIVLAIGEFVPSPCQTAVQLCVCIVLD